MPLNQDLGLVENTLTGETDLTMGRLVMSKILRWKGT